MVKKDVIVPTKKTSVVKQEEKSEQTSEYALYGDVYIDGQDEKSGVCGIYSAE